MSHLSHFGWKFLATALFAVLGFGLATPSAEAQVLYGSMIGSVSDASGGVIPSAQVTITNKGTGATLQTESGADGLYRFTNVLAGTYDLSVTASGFRQYTQQDIPISVNLVQRVDVAMQVGQVTETITVEGAALTLQTEKTDISANLNPKEVTDMPLPRYRNYQSLINLVPGATPARFQNANTDSPARALTTNVNGTNRNNNNTRIDGSTSVFIWLPHHSAYVPPAETVETVNISTNNFDAEQGMAGGAAVTVTTKSGTNELHGSAFWLHENGATAAKDTYFSATAKRPVSQIQIPGVTLGGPIKKDKIFFFGAYEGLIERVNRNRIYSVGSEAVRRGDFSAAPNPIYDPLTAKVAQDASGKLAGVRTPFANNQIPADRFASPSKIIQSSVPSPNRPGHVDNYFAAAGQRMDRHNYDVKVNYNQSEKSAMWGKFSLMDADVTGQFGLGEAGGQCLCDGGGGTGITKQYVATFGHTYTFAPTFLMDWTLGYTKMNQNVLGPDFGTNFGSDVWGIPGTNGPDPRQSGMPRIEIAGYSPLGNIDGWEPIFRNDDSYTLSVNFSKLSGAHDLRFGLDGIRHHLNHWQPEIGGGPRGRVNYNQEVTSQPGASFNFFNGYASFLLGQPFQYQKSIQFEKMTAYEYQYAFYIRDRWQITPKLTATLGLRWEFYPLMTRAGRGGIEGFEEDTGLVPLGGLANIPKDLGIETSKKLIGPRVGLAYRATENMVIRTGWGVTFNPMPLGRPLRGFYPLTIAADFNSDNAFMPRSSVSEGIPEVPLPDVSSGKIPLAPLADHRYITQGRLNRGYIESWNLIVERKLPMDIIGTIGYVGTKTVRSLADQDLNAAPVGGGRPGQPFNRPLYGNRTVGLKAWNGFADANYHSLQTSLNRRVSSGLTLKGQYTYSKAMNMTDDDGWAGMTWNYWDYLDRNYARAGYDQTHVFSIGFVYDLPFGKGQPMLQSGLASAIFGDWAINGVYMGATGRLRNVTASGASVNAPGNTQTADQVDPEANLSRGERTADHWFNTAAFKNVTEVRFGTSGRNVLVDPGLHNLDLSLFKNIPISERFKGQFRAEFFNFTNSPHYSNPNADVTSGSFGKITATNGNAKNRSIRFGLRVQW
jgi:hypothetical protein